MIECNLFCSFPEFCIEVHCQSISVYMWFNDFIGLVNLPFCENIVP
jgi:hypothetical protein